MSGIGAIVALFGLMMVIGNGLSLADPENKDGGAAKKIKIGVWMLLGWLQSGSSSSEPDDLLLPAARPSYSVSLSAVLMGIADRLANQLTEFKSCRIRSIAAACAKNAGTVRACTKPPMSGYEQQRDMLAGEGPPAGRSGLSEQLTLPHRRSC
jgi:hypothetical protein